MARQPLMLCGETYTLPLYPGDDESQEVHCGLPLGHKLPHVACFWFFDDDEAREDRRD